MSEPYASVVIVDDERRLADLYAIHLGDIRETRVFYDGETALGAIDETVEVVLLDRQMPGLSGDEVLAELRDRGYDLCVAMVTAIDPDDDILELAVDEYVVKPIDSSEIRAVVDGLLTRMWYTENVREYLAVASKRAALEANLWGHELASNDAYSKLQREEAAAKSKVDAAVLELLSSGASVGFREF